MPTLNDIYEEINQEVTDDLTIGATSTSKVAEFRLWEYIFAQASLILQGLWSIMKGELQAAADAVPTCNDAWWDREIRKFQYEHVLVLDPITKKYSYAVEDTDAQIIERVAVLGNRIKVAKAGPVALSVDEKAALTSYKKKIQPLGTNIVIISQDADLIRLPLTVHYDPIIPQATVQANVETAINDYLASLDFNVGKSGTFYITYLIDAIQEVEGVVDVIAGAIEAQQDGAAAWSAVVRKYVPVAGYITVDPATPLATSITYTPES